MTVTEAIFKTLEQTKKPATAQEIADFILKNNWCDFSNLTVATPMHLITSNLSTLIKNNDARIKRYKDKVYFYYLAKNENNIIMQEDNAKKYDKKTVVKTETYEERSLHKLLSTYLKSSADIYSKTIFHERSNRKDENQKWTHPDMIGVKFLKLRSESSQNLLKVVNQTETFKLYSYEIKKEINNDYELKESFFQTVSNSSWANYGYLAAFEISDNIKEEMERLNQSFGIGVILLDPNPYQSKILFPAKFKSIDIKTIDKLCVINEDFKKFIDQIEKLLTAEERYLKSTERELNEFCDDYFETEDEIVQYCKDKHIPIDNGAIDE
ncbi:MAG: hypothetical protein LBU73_00860 [Helicobacteraceae bacterium]|jgi:hypothetical protein|nr:hypothetical protein [Helicobacteraceae bacterium]